MPIKPRLFLAFLPIALAGLLLVPAEPITPPAAAKSKKVKKRWKKRVVRKRARYRRRARRVAPMMTLDTKELSDRALAKATGIPVSSIGYFLVDARTGKVLEKRQPNALFAPASAIKVPTTIAALAILGAGYRFQTRLAIRGDVSGGTLTGDVILIGGGDPMLTTEDYFGFVQALKHRGIRKVTGRFLYDGSLFPAVNQISPTHSPAVPYNPGLAPLTLNFNRVRLKWQRTATEGSLNAKIFSKTRDSEIEIDILGTGMAAPGIAGEHGLVLNRTRTGWRWLLTRRTRLRGEMWLPVKRASLHAAHVFRKYAAQNGVEIPKAQPGRLPRGARLIYRHWSEPLPAIAHKILRYSNNLAAELVGLQAALKLSGRSLDIRSSSRTLAHWIARRAKGASFTGYDVHNHSGLSVLTRVSPAQMVAILRFASKQRYGAFSYPDLLRKYWVGGGRRDPKFPKSIHVYAKTGTINYVRALAGFVTTRSNRKLVFALFISDQRAHEVATKRNLVHSSLGIRGWHWRSKRIQRGIVRRWALDH